MLITYEQWDLELWCFTWVFLVIRSFCEYQYFWLCDLDVEFWLFKKKINIAYNFWTVIVRVLIFHISIPCGKTFLWVPVLTLEFVSAKALIFHMSISSNITLTLQSGLRFEYFDVVNKIWIVRSRTLIFHMNIACDKIFLLVLNLLTLTFDHLFKFLKKKNKILEFPYCTWSFLVTISFYWYQNICPCDLGNLWNWPLSGAFCVSQTHLVRLDFDLAQECPYHLFPIICLFICIQTFHISLLIKFQGHWKRSILTIFWPYIVSYLTKTFFI